MEISMEILRHQKGIENTISILIKARTSSMCKKVYPQCYNVRCRKAKNIARPSIFGLF